jgi:membrane peptidoglycan carboxypeptidase
MTLHYRFLGSVRRAAQGRSRILAAAIIALACFLLVGSTAIVWAAYEITADLPQKNDIRDLADMAQATTIYDDDDQAVFTIFREQRIEVPLEKISPNLIKAVLSVEDQRFYEHGGIDFIRIAAAAVRNVELGRRAEGGSTITQQLARQSLLTRDKTFRRKVKEAILAAHIEHEY